MVNVNKKLLTEVLRQQELMGLKEILSEGEGLNFFKKLLNLSDLSPSFTKVIDDVFDSLRSTEPELVKEIEKNFEIKEFKVSSFSQLKRITSISSSVLSNLLDTLEQKVTSAILRNDNDEFIKLADQIVEYSLGNRPKSRQIYDYLMNLVQNKTYKDFEDGVNEYGSFLPNDIIEHLRIKAKNLIKPVVDTVEDEIDPASELGKRLALMGKEMGTVDKYLWDRVNKSNIFRRWLNINKISRKNWPLFRNKLLKNLDETVKENLDKNLKVNIENLRKVFTELDNGNRQLSQDIIDQTVAEVKKISKETKEQLGFWGTIYEKLEPEALLSFKNAISRKGTWSVFLDDWVASMKFTSTLMVIATIGEIFNGDLKSFDDLINESKKKYLTIVLPGVNIWTWSILAMWRWGKFAFSFVGDEDKDLTPTEELWGITLGDVKNWVESGENPIGIDYENKEKITKYVALNSKNEVIATYDPIKDQVIPEGKGYFIQVYTNTSDDKPYTTLERTVKSGWKITEKK